MVLVGIHELGHFLAARMFGVKVYEFWLGIPPKAKELFTDSKGTKYTLNWLPIGGFVRLKWEQEAEDGVIDDDSLASKPIWQQVIIMIAGIVFNVILAGILFWIVIMNGFSPSPHVIDSKPNSPLSKVQYESVLFPPFHTEQDLLSSDIILPESMEIVSYAPGHPAYEAWLRDGDVITQINGQTIVVFEDLRTIVWNNPAWSPLEIRIKESEKIFDVTPKEGLIGIYMNRIKKLHEPFPQSFVTWFIEGWNQTVLTLKLTVITISDLIFWSKEEKEIASQSVGWPVAIWGVFVNIASDNFSWTNVFLFAGMISVALASFNLLPIPALDGGQIATILLGWAYTKLTWKKVNPKIKSTIQGVSFLLLLLLAVVIAVKDVASFF